MLAVSGSEALATLFAVHGIFTTSIGRRYAAFVWVYALVWFLASDRAKVLAYRILDPARTESPPDVAPPIASVSN